MKRVLGVLATVCAIVLLTFRSSPCAQEKITVLSDSALRPALIHIGEAFRHDSGRQVEFVFGPPPVVNKKVAESEKADVLIIQRDFLGELIESGKVLPGDHPVIGRVGIGLAGRADAPVRDVATVETFRQVLLSADSLIFNTLASGNHFAAVLERLGIAESVKTKVVRVPPGGGLYERVIQGKGNDLAVGTIPIIQATQGVRLIGPLPPEFQSYLVYVAAPMSGASSPQTAKMFSAFLAGAGARALFAANGVE